MGSRPFATVRGWFMGVSLMFLASGCTAGVFAPPVANPWEPPNPWPKSTPLPASADVTPSAFATEVAATTAPIVPAASLSVPRVVSPEVPPTEPTVPPTVTSSDPKILPAPALLEPAPPATGLNFKIRGRIEADAITVSQSEKDKLIYGDFQNATGFRRARIGAEGSASEQVFWEAEFDFAGGNTAFKNMFVGVKQLPIIGEMRVGHLLEPFSLEGQISSRFFPFVERSPSFSLDPARNWGVAIYSHTDNERIAMQAGAFRSGTNNFGNDIGDGNDMAYTGRITGLPWYEASGDSLQLLHIGGAISQRYAKNDTVSFNQGPQSNLLQSGTDNPVIPFVPNISIPATQNQLFNVQSALVLGPLSFQAEWSATRVDQINGGPVFFQGGYVMASYFLTGEHREYDRAYGTFREPKIRSPFVCMDGPGSAGRGPGGWELTARLAYMDYDSSNLAPGPNGLPIGNRLTEVTLGLNWYLNDNARFMFNYTHAMPTDPTFGSSLADTFTVRSAIFW